MLRFDADTSEQHSPEQIREFQLCGQHASEAGTTNDPFKSREFVESVTRLGYTTTDKLKLKDASKWFKRGYEHAQTAHTSFIFSGRIN